jgi:hypothetical protein
MNTVSHKRLIRGNEQQRAADGHKLCKVCQTPVPKGRSSYCSNECWMRNTPGMVRGRVRLRDKEVCALCGFDCKAWKNQNETMRSIEHECYQRAPELINMLVMARENFKKAMPRRDWQADHITPVIEGGGLCGLDGYRTLCDECHKKETAALAARRAEQRRFAQQPLLQLG